MKVLLTLPREVLYGRIAARFQSDFVNELPTEVRGLLAAGVPLTAPAFSAIGYRDTAALISGALSEGQWAERLLRETRRYAKRQEAWFRRESGLVPVRADCPDLVDFVAREARPLFLFSAAGEGG